MKEFNQVMKAVKELMNGKKCVEVKRENVDKFVKVCEVFNVPINGGAYYNHWNEAGQYFYID